jgi:hypothetical protein
MTKKLLKVYNGETTYHTFSHFILAYLFLSNGCGIHDIVFKPTLNDIGELTVTSDGMLIFRAIAHKDFDQFATSTLFIVYYFDEPIERTEMTLDEIKKLIIKKLSTCQ